LALDRVQGPRSAQALGGHDLLAVEGRRGDEAGVDGGPLGGLAVGPGDHDRAGPALTFCAPLLGPGQSLVPEPVESSRARVSAIERAHGAVDLELVVAP